MTEQVAAGTTPWTGEFEIPLINARGFDSGHAVARVFRLTVDVLFDDRALGVMQREEFREWLIFPGSSVFEADLMVWSFEAATVCLTIGGTAYFQVPHRTVIALRATI